MRRLLALLILPILAVLACSSDDDDAATDVESGTETTGAPADPGTDTTAATDSPASVDTGTSPTTAATDTTGDSGTSGASGGSVPPLEVEAYTSEIYADPTHWLCRPDMTDSPCETDLDVTVVQEDGTTEVVPHEVATDPAFDCFYVYPTINMTGGGNAPFDGEYGPELGITRTQAGRFSRLCRVYAPVYRQITMDAFASPDAAELMDTAYGDVADAFRHYLANDNEGRPFVVLGHSQGSGMLNRLLADEIDGDEALRAHLISALLIGGSVSVPEGEDVGGDFQNIPACRAETQTGCVVTFASFRADAPPPEDSLFGRPREGDGVALCTNPAALGGGSAELQAIYPDANEAWAEGATDVAEITTPYFALPGLLSGECVSEGGFDYLAITVHADPSGPRIDDISGDIGPAWGLHAVDYNLVMGDLIDLVATQAAAWPD
jgi:hypothetical protein